MKPKAIVFDAYGTLFDVNSAAEKGKNKLGNKWESFANFWRTTQLEYTWLRSLMKKHKDFWQITEDSLDKSMKVFNIDNNLKNELLNLYKILSPYPEVKKVFFCTCKQTKDQPLCDGSHNIKQFMKPKAIVFDAYGTLLMLIQPQRNVRIKQVVNGKILRIFGELLNLNIPG